MASPELRRAAAVVLRGYALLPRTVFLIAWLWLRQRGTHRRAIKRLLRAVKGPCHARDPLSPLDPGLYQVAPWFLRGVNEQNAEPSTAEPSSELMPEALTIVHLLGTGENAYSPLTGLRELCRVEPRLRALRHVIADTSFEAASYLGPSEFARRLQRTLAPLLARLRERLVIVGLSRGATAALDLGSELADVHHTRVGILALAPPLARPGRVPASVLNIGGFEPIAENFALQLELLPFLRPLGRWVMRNLYLRFSGFVLAELRLVSEASIAMFARFIAGIDPADACLRSVREFALLGRVSDAELRHAISGVTQRLARTEGARAFVCFGNRDSWVEVAACEARLTSLLDRDRVPAERLRLVKLDGHGHGLGREPDQDFTELAALLWNACEHASRQPAGAPQSIATLTETA